MSYSREKDEWVDFLDGPEVTTPRKSPTAKDTGTYMSMFRTSTELCIEEQDKLQDMYNR